MRYREQAKFEKSAAHFVLLPLLLLALWLKPVDEPLSFRAIGIFDTIAGDDVRGCFQVWKSSDGINVTAGSESLRTRDDAKERLKYFSDRAYKVVQRAPTPTLEGVKPDDKLVAVLPGGVASMAWIQGNQLQIVSSVSLKHILEFERLCYGPQASMRCN